MPDVDALKVELVVGGLFPVEVDGVGVGRGRLGGHLQLFRGGLLPVGGEGGERRNGQGQEQEGDEQGPAWHGDLEQGKEQVAMATAGGAVRRASLATLYPACFAADKGYLGLLMVTLREFLNRSGRAGSDKGWILRSKVFGMRSA